MSLDGKILNRAKTRLDARRAAAERRLEERRREAYRRDPRIARIDGEMKETVYDAIRAALSGGDDPVDALEAIKDRSLSLQEERALALIRAGLSPDCLTETYSCPKCRDTGYNGTALCSCLMELYREEELCELGRSLRLGEDTFENFRLDYYSDVPDPRSGISPRAMMSEVFDFACDWARGFSEKSMNLFFHGAAGLGKTFLSAAIAQVVAEKGFSVVYDRAAAIFSRYEREKFSRPDTDTEALSAEIRRIETCDLLIVDDLGTEFPTSFVTSALYTLLDTRLVSGKKTIISSNLTLRELADRYSPAIMSRLEGEFTSLRFVGQDIRKLKSHEYFQDADEYNNG